MSAASAGTDPYVRAVPVEFPRVGSRDYIQGVSIACALARACAAHPPHELPLRIEHVKFMRKTLWNGEILVSARGRETDLPRDIVALLRGATAGGSVCAGYRPDPDRQVTRTIPGHAYAIEPLVPPADFAGTWRASCSDTEQFLLTLIEINKRTIRMSMPTPGNASVIDLVYAEHLDYTLPRMFGEGEVKVVNLGMREFGGLMYVLNQLEFVDLRGTAQKVRLNYSVRK